MTETQAVQPAPAKPDYLVRVEEVLMSIFRAGRFDLRVSITAAPAAPDPDAPQWIVNLTGADADLVLESHAALLDAFASIALKAARLDENPARRVSFDCEGYRGARATELKLMAEMAAERVREDRQPFALSPMNSAERRLVHLALREAPSVRTESEGAGPQRKVIIYPVK
ncbi:MAG: protein jag [Terriglobia bacterium]